MAANGSQPDLARFLGAFPSAVGPDAATAIAVMPPAQLHNSHNFVVTVEGEEISIPYRISNPEPDAAVVGGLSPAQRLAMGCIYTRHHDGFVRQRNLEAVIASTEEWVVPFVVRLVGEYVIEIIEMIQRDLGDLADPGNPHRRAYAAFLIDNPDFLEITSRRATSYWATYYRNRYPAGPMRPNRDDYPGHRLIASFRALAQTA